jgi:hypothetical protein
MIILIIHALVSLANCGMIETLDYSIDYLNVGYTSRLTFIFRLETGLGAGNYLSLLLPLTIG